MTFSLLTTLAITICFVVVGAGLLAHSLMLYRMCRRLRFLGAILNEIFTDNLNSRASERKCGTGAQYQKRHADGER